MKKKSFLSLLIFVMFFAVSCESTYDFEVEPEAEVNFTRFCSHLGLEDIREAIPLVNNFLTEALAHIECYRGWEYGYEIFEILVAGLNSLFCNVNARVLYGRHNGTGQKVAFGIGFPAIDNNGIVRELQVDFAFVGTVGTFMQIEGFSHIKQDAIFVATNFTRINRVFDFINALGLDVTEVDNGRFISSMPADSTNLNRITKSLKAKPYTRDAWVIGHLDWHATGITFFVTLFDMHNRNYQTDWIRTMANYQFHEEVCKDLGYLIRFRIPEGAGREWERRFGQYNFVRWTERSYSQHRIR